MAALVIAVALVLAAASTASGHAQRPSGAAARAPQWIAFVARQRTSGVEQIYRIDRSGKGLKQLTRGAYSAVGPAVSPDGKWIAFSRLGAGIFRMHADGSGVRALTTNGRDGFPAWSPDGKQIAFIRPLGSAWRAMVMSASGAGQRQLRRAPPAGRPSWTSRGLLIPTNGDLAKVDPRSGRVQKLFGALIDASVGMDTTTVSPDLSIVTSVGPRAPDPGDKGCGEGVPCQRFALYIQDLRRQKPPRILVRDAGPASFSPDGKTLAFVLGNRLVFRAVANGASTSIPLGKLSPTTSTAPAWQLG